MVKNITNRLHRPASGIETSPALYVLLPEGQTRTHDICTASFILSLTCILVLILLCSLLTANEISTCACSDFPVVVVVIVVPLPHFHF